MKSRGLVKHRLHIWMNAVWFNKYAGAHFQFVCCTLRQERQRWWHNAMLSRSAHPGHLSRLVTLYTLQPPHIMRGWQNLNTNHSLWSHGPGCHYPPLLLFPCRQLVMVSTPQCRYIRRRRPFWATLAVIGFCLPTLGISQYANRRVYK